MSNYYCFIAGLPEITLDDERIFYSVKEFKEELENVLSPKDKKIVSVFFLQFDNKNLLSFLRDKESSFDNRGNYSKEEIEELCQNLKESDTYSSKKFPGYFIRFIQAYIQNKPVYESLMWEDQLSSLYYEYAGHCKNKFISEWYHLNLNLNNMMASVTCRKYDLDNRTAILGSSEIADVIRESGQRDMGLTGVLDYLENVLQISEEKNLKEREKQLDIFRWEWLEEHAFFHYFSVERIFVYLIKLELIERWMKLDPESGKKRFRKIINTLKNEIKAENYDFK